MGILEIQSLSKHFGALKAIDNLDLVIREDEITAIIGPNGAGKTTLYNVITGKFPPTKGKIKFKGIDITASPPHRLVRLGLARSFQVTNIFPTMSVLDNVRVALIVHSRKSHRLFNMADKDPNINEESMHILRLVEMDSKKNVLCTQLSHGEKRRVELAIVMASAPAMILLDEPTAGMSKAESRHTVQLIRKLFKQEKICFVLTEHDMEVIFGISDRIVVLDHGKLIADGTPDQIKENPAVKEAYLGKELEQ